MKKSTRRSRNHRNSRMSDGEKRSKFFSKASDGNVQAKEEGSFFQPKLTISPVNDPAEKEADLTADKVVKGIHQQSNTQVQKKRLINRAEEEKEMAAKRDIQRKEQDEEKLKTKLEVQRQAEEEEPAAKLEVQRQAEEEEPAAKLEVQRQAEEEEPAAKLEVQRQAEEEEPAAKLEVQRQAEEEEPAAKKENSANLESMIQETKGAGFALPNDVRQEMEAQINADFSRVRIHTDTTAIKMCRMIRAQAFTHGYDIYFNAGKYNPDTDTGKNLLAHELTHVVQQKG